MRRMIIAAAAMLAVLVTRAENWCQWLDESCKIAGYVNVEETREIPLIAELIDGQDNVSRFISAVRDWTSVDLDSITDAWFGVAGEDNALFILEGDFNLSVIRGTLGTIEQFQVQTPPGAEFAVLMPDDKKPGKMNMAAFLTPTALVIGQPPRVQAFLANRQAGATHPRARDLAGLDTSEHLFECLLLTVPNEKGDIPQVILDNVALVHIAADAEEKADISLAVHPRDLDMVPALSKLGEGVVDLYRCLPENQVRLDPIKKALLDHASVSSTAQAAVVQTSLPLDLVRGPLAAKLNPTAGGQP